MKLEAAYKALQEEEAVLMRQRQAQSGDTSAEQLDIVQAALKGEFERDAAAHAELMAKMEAEMRELQSTMRGYHEKMLGRVQQAVC